MLRLARCSTRGWPVSSPRVACTPAARLCTSTSFGIDRMVKKYGGVEVVSYHPKPQGRAEPKSNELVFVHSEWTAAWVWEENMMPWFAKRGYTCHALSLRGHGNSDGSCTEASFEDYSADLENAMDAVRRPNNAVLIAHGLGASIVEHYLAPKGEDRGAAVAALLAPYPPPVNKSLAFTVYNNLIKGNFFKQFKAFTNAKELGFMIRNLDIAKDKYFSPELPAEKAEDYFKRLQYSSATAMSKNLTTEALNAMESIPVKKVLVVRGTADKIVDETCIQATTACFCAPAGDSAALSFLNDVLVLNPTEDVVLVPGLTHAVPLDPLWEDVCHLIDATIKETVGNASNDAAAERVVDFNAEIIREEMEKLGNVGEKEKVEEKVNREKSKGSSAWKHEIPLSPVDSRQIMLKDVLELQCYWPADSKHPEKPLPILFVHGEWTGAWMYQKHFLPYFAARGYDAFALSFTGHGGSARPSSLNDRSINPFHRHLEELETALDFIHSSTGEMPILVGHAIGAHTCAHFAARQTEGREVPLLVSLAPYPPIQAEQDALFLQQKLGQVQPMLIIKQMLKLRMGSPFYTEDSVNKFLFSDRGHPAVVKETLSMMDAENPLLLARIAKEPHKATEQLQKTSHLSGGQDVIVTYEDLKKTVAFYKKDISHDLDVIPGAPHLMTLGESWKEVAASVESFLDEFFEFEYKAREKSDDNRPLVKAHRVIPDVGAFKEPAEEKRGSGDEGEKETK